MTSEAEDRRTRRLRELLEQWRIDADLCDATERPDHALAKRLCADELAAVLDTEGDRQQTPTKDKC